MIRWAVEVIPSSRRKVQIPGGRAMGSRTGLNLSSGDAGEHFWWQILETFKPPRSQKFIISHQIKSNEIQCNHNSRFVVLCRSPPARRPLPLFPFPLPPPICSFCFVFHFIFVEQFGGPVFRTVVYCSSSCTRMVFFPSACAGPGSQKG